MKLLFYVLLCVIVGCVIWRVYWKIQLHFNPHIMNDMTPDDLFPLTHKSTYNLRTENGLRDMKKKKVVICALLRNASNRIPSIIKQVENLCSYFLDYKVLIVENDSSDDTRSLLMEWHHSNPKICVMGCEKNSGKSCHLSKASYLTQGHAVNKQRIDKMAYLRGLYLEEIKTDGELMQYDYCCMWDLDLIGKLYIDGVANSMGWLSAENNINAIGAMGVYRWMGFLLFYDTYAYVEKGECPHINYKTWYDLKKGIAVPFNKRGTSPIEVESVFSGFCIYKIKELLKDEVDYTTTEVCNIECEHHILNKKISGVYLNPSMIYIILRND